MSFLSKKIAYCNFFCILNLHKDKKTILVNLTLDELTKIVFYLVFIMLSRKYKNNSQVPTYLLFHSGFVKNQFFGSINF